MNQDLTAAAGTSASTGWGSALTSYSYGSGRYIVYIDMNQHVNQLVWTGAVWVNQDLTAAAGYVTAAAAGSALTNLIDGSGPHIVYIDINQHINQLMWTGGVWFAQDLTATAGAATPAAAGSGLTSFVEGSHVTIAYVDANQHLNQLLWTGTQWVNVDLTAATGTPNARAGSAITSFLLSDGPHVVYIE